jgi:hypothetical protein
MVQNLKHAFNTKWTHFLAPSVLLIHGEINNSWNFEMNLFKQILQGSLNDLK